MTRRLPAVAVICCLSSAGMAQRSTPPQASLDLALPHATADSPVIRLPEGIDPSDCQANTYVTGPFGGSGWFGMRFTGRDLAIAVRVRDERARTARAIVFCRGARIEIVQIAPVPSERIVVAVGVSVLAAIPLQGIVTFAANAQPGRPVLLRLTYLLDWAHEYFGISDGMIPMFDLGRHRVRPDGTFEILVPDFANDPTIARFTHRGTFWIQAVDPDTLNPSHVLSNSSDPAVLQGRIPVGWSYPYLRLQATPARVASR